MLRSTIDLESGYVIVFQTNVPVQVLLELFETGIKGTECRASAGRRRVGLTQFADLRHEISSKVVIFGHHRNRNCDGSKAHFTAHTKIQSNCNSLYRLQICASERYENILMQSSTNGRWYFCCLFRYTWFIARQYDRSKHKSVRAFDRRLHVLFGVENGDCQPIYGNDSPRKLSAA